MGPGHRPEGGKSGKRERDWSSNRKKAAILPITSALGHRRAVTIKKRNPRGQSGILWKHGDSIRIGRDFFYIFTKLEGY